MVNISELLESEYLSVEFVKNSPTKKALIINQGTEKVFDGKKSLELLVSIDGKQKIWKLNKTSLKNLSTAWGKDSNLWVNKLISFSVLPMQGGREAVIANSN